MTDDTIDKKEIEERIEHLQMRATKIADQRPIKDATKRALVDAEIAGIDAQIDRLFSYLNNE